MLTVHQAIRPRPAKTPKVGLAIAGGGPVGAIFELGALRAIDEAVEGLRLHDLDIYVGVSAGAFIAAGLANRITTARMCRIFMGRRSGFTFEPEKLLKPAYREYARRVSLIPGIIGGCLRDIIHAPLQTNLSSVTRPSGQVITGGIFNSKSVHHVLSKVFESESCSNDFRDLDDRLYIVAVDLHSGAAVRFGSKGHDDVSISRAVQASAALPGLYPPVKIGDQYFVDGALRRTMHAPIALDEGVDLLLAINPLVPYDADTRPQERQIPVRKLIPGGLPLILSQKFHAMIQSRMNGAFNTYHKIHPEADLVLVGPDRGDEEIFFTNIFSFASRRTLCDHAYRLTRLDLHNRADQIEETLRRHGMSLNRELLAIPDRTLNDSLDEAWFGSTPVARELTQALDELEWHLKRRALSRDQAVGASTPVQEMLTSEYHASGWQTPTAPLKPPLDDP